MDTAPAPQKKNALSAIMLHIAVPVALQSVVAFAVNLADTVMLGQMGEVQLSASALANQVFFIVTLAVGGIASGTSVLTGQAWGRKDTASIHKILAYAYLCGVAFALLASATAIAFPAAVMRAFTNDAAVVAAGAGYLRIVAFTYLLYTVTTVTGGVLQSVHTVRISMLASVAAMAINISLNWVLIFGKLGAPALGIQGAAIATLIARVCEFSIMVWYVRFKEDKLFIRFGKLLPLDKTLAKGYFHTTLPVLANELFWALGEAALAMVLGRMGTEVVAANSICNSAVQIASVLSRGVTTAACVIVANTVGAGKTDELPAQKRYFQRVSVGLGLVAGALVFCCRPLLLALYNVGPVTLAYAGQIILIEAVLQPFRYFQIMNMMGILRGGGDVRFAMLNDLIFLWGFTVPLGFVCGLVLHWPVAAVCVVIKFDQVIKAATSEWRLRGCKWVHNTVHVVR